MGKKTRLNGNPELAKNHQAGAPIVRLQILTHSTYGAIGYSERRLWALHANLAGLAAERLSEVDDEVLARPVDSSNMRTLYDDLILQDAYGSGTDMVSNIVRAVQHLAYEMGQYARRNLTTSTVIERLREAAALHGMVIDTTAAGFQALVEMVNVRDGIEHPKHESVFTGDPNRWDEVPLAWILSDRSLAAYSNFHHWFSRLIDEWEEVIANAPKSSITLQIHQRGVESKLPSKQAPRITPSAGDGIPDSDSSKST